MPDLVVVLHLATPEVGRASANGGSACRAEKERRYGAIACGSPSRVATSSGVRVTGVHERFVTRLYFGNDGGLSGCRIRHSAEDNLDVVLKGRSEREAAL